MIAQQLLFIYNNILRYNIIKPASNIKEITRLKFN